MTVLNLQVGASADDSSTRNGTASYSATFATGLLGNNSSTRQHWTSWGNVTIAQGTTLTSAVISLCIASGGTGYGTLKIKTLAEDADNHTPPTTGTDANTRTLTAGTAWPDITSAPTVDSWISLDITSDIQTVINRAGFASGNKIGTRTVDNGTVAFDVPTFYLYDGDSTKAAKLDITYTAGGATGPRGLLLLGCGA